VVAVTDSDDFFGRLTSVFTCPVSADEDEAPSAAP
jgi:hypothetical protein